MRTRATKEKTRRIDIEEYKQAIIDKCGSLSAANEKIGRSHDFLGQLFRKNTATLSMFYLNEIQMKLGVDYRPFLKKNKNFFDDESMENATEEHSEENDAEESEAKTDIKKQMDDLVRDYLEKKRRLDEIDAINTLNKARAIIVALRLLKEVM